MSDLIFNRIVTVYRGVLTTDVTEGARLVATAIITGMSCTMQPGRVRHPGETANPSGVGSQSVDDMSQWKMQCTPPVRMLKNDTVVDDIGRRFAVASCYETAMGSNLVVMPVDP